MIVNPMLYSGKKLPELDNPGTAADLLAGKQLVDQYGNPLTGTMPQKSASDLTASGASIIVPAGYYPSQVSKSVSTAAHPKPTLSRSGGTVTATHVQSAGYTSGGTTTETLGIPTHAGGNYAPTTYSYTAASSGYLLTGNVKIIGDANLKAENIKSGVSIFGVAGTANTLAYGTIQIKNNTNRYLHVRYGNGEREQMEEYWTRTLTVPIGVGFFMYFGYDYDGRVPCINITENSGCDYDRHDNVAVVWLTGSSASISVEVVYIQ